MIIKIIKGLFLLIVAGCLLALSVAVGLIVAPRANAQVSNPVGKHTTQVSASIGELYLSVEGYISPYASVVMTLPDGTFLRSGVADSGGNFSISQVLMKTGFTGFCLTAVDFKRLGESTACFTFPPQYSRMDMKDIFLPPTLGLYRTEIAEGGTAIAFGYTMPGALVRLKLSNGQILTTYADSTGYYEFRIKNLKAGKYQLVADAHYKGKQSLSPTKGVVLTALSWWEQFTRFLKDLWNKFVNFLTSWKLGPLWVALPILILIIILILKLWPDRFTFIYDSKLMRMFSKGPSKFRKLHHWWWVGY